MENKNKIRNPWISIIPAMVTIVMSSLFLWRKLIDFSKGTPEGGRFAAIGVCDYYFGDGNCLSRS